MSAVVRPLRHSVPPREGGRGGGSDQVDLRCKVVFKVPCCASFAFQSLAKSLDSSTIAFKIVLEVNTFIVRFFFCSCASLNCVVLVDSSSAAASAGLRAE